MTARESLRSPVEARPSGVRPSAVVASGVSAASIGAFASVQGIGTAGVLVAVVASVLPSIIWSEAALAWILGVRARMLLRTIADLRQIDDTTRQDLSLIHISEPTRPY